MPDPSQPLSTRLAESGRTVEAAVNTANLPVHRASTVLFDSLAQAEAAGRAVGQGERHATTYGTVGTPTTMALMDALAEVEGGGHPVRAALMPSGLAAITTTLLAILVPGDHLLVTDSAYGPTRVFCDGLLARMGVETSYYDPAIGAGIASQIRPNTRLIWLESPGSYTFEVQDVPAICALARERGVLTMIDNTWASPVFARPFDWGVDLSMLALTKYWGGHSDLLMGAVVANEALWPRIWAATRQLGQCASGDDAYLVLRGLRTVEVRMRRHQENGLEVAHWLQRREEVESVLHPALFSHPQHALWRRDFSGASGLFSFSLEPGLFGDEARLRAAIAALCERRKHFAIGYSWGGFESLIMPAQIGHLRSVRPWAGGPLVRLHVGLEDPRSLIADLQAGFEAMEHALAS